MFTRFFFLIFIFCSLNTQWKGLKWWSHVSTQHRENALRLVLEIENINKHCWKYHEWNHFIFLLLPTKSLSENNENVNLAFIRVDIPYENGLCYFRSQIYQIQLIEWHFKKNRKKKKMKNEHWNGSTVNGLNANWTYSEYRV